MAHMRQVKGVAEMSTVTPHQKWAAIYAIYARTGRLTAEAVPIPLTAECGEGDESTLPTCCLNPAVYWQYNTDILVTWYCINTHGLAR